MKGKDSSSYYWISSLLREVIIFSTLQYLFKFSISYLKKNYAADAENVTEFKIAVTQK